MNNFNWRMGLSVCPCLRFVVFLFLYILHALFSYLIFRRIFVPPNKLTTTNVSAHFDMWVVPIAKLHTPKLKHKTSITRKFLWPLHLIYNGHTHVLPIHPPLWETPFCSGLILGATFEEILKVFDVILTVHLR